MSSHDLHLLSDATLACWEAFRAIAKRPHQRPVQLLCSYSVDGVTSRHAFTSLCAAYHIQYEVHVLETMDQLSSIVERNKNNFTEWAMSAGPFPAVSVKAARTIGAGSGTGVGGASMASSLMIRSESMLIKLEHGAGEGDGGGEDAAEKKAKLEDVEDSTLPPVEWDVNAPKDIYVLLGFGALTDVTRLFDWHRCVEVVHVLDAARPVHMTYLAARASESTSLTMDEDATDAAEEGGEGEAGGKKKSKKSSAAATNPAGATASVRHRVVLWDRLVIEAQVEELFRSMPSSIARGAKRQRGRDGARAGRRALSSVGTSSDDEEDEEDDEEESEDDEEAKSEEPKVSVVPWRTHLLPAYAQRYYQSVHCVGRSGTRQLLELAKVLGQPLEPYVWCAAVSLASDWLLRRVSKMVYEFELGSLLATTVASVGGGSGGGSGGNGGVGGNGLHQRLLSEEISVTKNPLSSHKPPPTTANHNPNHPHQQQHANHSINVASTLRKSIDVEAPCLRHTNLWFALWHSTPIISTFGLYKGYSQHATEALRTLLSTVGLSIEHSQKPWVQIDSHKRQEVIRSISDELKARLALLGGGSEHGYSGAESTTNGSTSTKVKLGDSANGTPAATNATWFVQSVSRMVGFTQEGMSNIDVAWLILASLSVLPPAGSGGRGGGGGHDGGSGGGASGGVGEGLNGGVPSTWVSRPVTNADGTLSTNAATLCWHPYLAEFRRQQFWQCASLLFTPSTDSEVFLSGVKHLAGLCQSLHAATETLLLSSNSSSSGLSSGGLLGAKTLMPYAVLGMGGGRTERGGAAAAAAFEDLWCPIRLRLLLEHAAAIVRVAVPAVKPRWASGSGVDWIRALGDPRPLVLACATRGSSSAWTAGTSAAGTIIVTPRNANNSTQQAPQGGSAGMSGVSGAEEEEFCIGFTVPRPTASLSMLQVSRVQAAMAASLIALQSEGYDVSVATGSRQDGAPSVTRVPSIMAPFAEYGSCGSGRVLFVRGRETATHFLETLLLTFSQPKAL